MDASEAKEISDKRTLLDLMRELSDPANRARQAEIEAAIQVITSRAVLWQPPTPSAQVAARIQSQINALHPVSLGEWPTRVCKENHNALPLHGNLIYLWAIQPAGTVLCLDHEAFGHPVEPETDALIIFAVMVQGARRYEELTALLPPPPAGAAPCDGCCGRGWLPTGETTSSSCMSCSGLGWFIARLGRSA